MKRRHDAQRRQFGFPCATDERHVSTDRIARGLKKYRAVFGIACSSGRHDGDVIDAHIATKGTECLQGLDSLVHAVLRQNTSRGDAAPKTAQHLFIEERSERAG